MSGSSGSSSLITKIIGGVSIAVISALIIHFLNLDSENSRSQNYSNTDYLNDSEYEEVESLNYGSFLGIYYGTSVNTTRYTEGSTILDIKELSTNKVVVEIQWYNGLTGEGRLLGTVTGNSINVQGGIYSSLTGSWDIEIEIALTDGSNTISGTYKLYPLAGNPHGIQNGKFSLVKE